MTNIISRRDRTKTMRSLTRQSTHNKLPPYILQNTVLLINAAKFKILLLPVWHMYECMCGDDDIICYAPPSLPTPHIIVSWCCKAYLLRVCPTYPMAGSHAASTRHRAAFSFSNDINPMQTKININNSNYRSLNLAEELNSYNRKKKLLQKSPEVCFKTSSTLEETVTALARAPI